MQKQIQMNEEERDLLVAGGRLGRVKDRLRERLLASNSTSVVISKKLALKKEPVSVAIQGELGAYSQQAVYSFFGRDVARKIIPLPTLQRVFSAIDGSASTPPDFAVVPIENSLAGSVGETIDLLISRNVRVVGETSVPVSHCLIIHKDTTLDRIRKVMSHPQALAQCREYPR